MRKYEIVEGMKYCPRCGEYRPYSEFFKHKTQSLGLTGFCKVHHAESSKAALDRYNAKHKQGSGTGRGRRKGDKTTPIEIRTKCIPADCRYISEVADIVLLDETPLPIKSPYQGVKMMDIPAWYLLKISGSCTHNVQKYIDDNIEILKMEIK